MCLSPSILFYFHLPSVLFSWARDRDRLCPLHPRVPPCPAQKAAPVPWCLCPRASLLNHPLFTATGEEKQSLAEAPPDGIFICGIAGEGDGCWNPPFLVLVPSPLPEHHGWGRQRGDSGQDRGAEPPLRLWQRPGSTRGCGGRGWREAQTQQSYFPPPAEKFSQRLGRP